MEDGYRDEGRRSPPGANRRRYDRRSRSPRNERYQSRNSRDDYHSSNHSGGRHEPYRRRSPGPSHPQNIDRYVPGQDPPVPLTNSMPNPLTLDHQVGFNWFADWWRKDKDVKEEKERQRTGTRRPQPRVKGEQEAREEREKEREQIQAAYDTYKEKFQIQMSRMFVHQHKAEEWFKEKYEPVIRDVLKQKLVDFRRDIFVQWQEDFTNGLFNDFTLEGIYKAESNGAGGVLEKEEGETTAAAEVLGVGDLLPSKGGDLRDEAALHPALLIKTIATHVSREKMEEFCKEHLGTGEGGFKHLSLSDPNPMKKYSRIGWVMLNDGGDSEVEVPKAKVENKESNGDDGDDGDDDDAMETETVKQSAAEKALAAIDGKTILDEERGSFTVHVGIHNPSSAPRKKALWDLFSAPERVERDLELVEKMISKFEQEMGSGVNGMAMITEEVESMRSRGQLKPVESGAVPKSSPDEDVEEGEEGEDVEMNGEEEIDSEDLLVQKKKLDLMVEYLRRVFNFCFYCVFEADSVHEISRKCPGGHLRRPRASLTSQAKVVAKASAYGEEFPLKKEDKTAMTEKENGDEGGSPSAEKPRVNHRAFVQLQRAFNWVKTYEDKLYQILEPESVNLTKIGGRNVEDALEEDLKKFVKQEDEAKFRCKVPECTKLFKGATFWRKHAEKRHEEWFSGIKKELELINAYVLDPAHVSAPRADAPPGGQFPNPAFQPGQQRGFNLPAMPYGIPASMATGMPNGYPTHFGHYPVTMPPPPFAAAYGMPASQAGPMRRGPGRFNGRATGQPYEVQSRDDRNARRVLGARPVAGRFPDASGGAEGVPRAAVAGRSIKSYEDLDAVATSGDGDLNY